MTAFARRLSRAVLTLLAFPSAFAAAPEEAPAAAAAAPVAQPLTAADANSWLDGYLPYALKTNDIAGAVVVIVKDGEVLTERGYGYADVAAKKPIDPKLTLFRPGSVSKLFTWTAVMQLVEQGKIDLDADVNQYLDFRIPPREGKPVTMRNLMQHTAGFEEQAKGVISDNPQAPGFEVLLKAWVPQRVFAPGTTPAYSNYGASLAGYIVQRVSGGALRHLCREAHLRAARHEVLELPPAPASRARATDVQGLPHRLGGGATLRDRRPRTGGRPVLPR